LGGAVSNQGFEKLTGADADKFTLAGNKLTFIAKAFEAGSDNTYPPLPSIIAKDTSFSFPSLLVVSGIIFCVFSSVEKLAAVAIRSFSITVTVMVFSVSRWKVVKITVTSTVALILTR
jgi:hypothetical protein